MTSEGRHGPIWTCQGRIPESMGKRSAIVVDVTMVLRREGEQRGNGNRQSLALVGR
jgi:hypothetical protein